MLGYSRTVRLKYENFFLRVECMELMGRRKKHLIMKRAMCILGCIHISSSYIKTLTVEDD